MSTAAQASFFASEYPDASYASAQTGVPVSVVLAQWANETAYGAAPAFASGNNYAGVSPGGRVAAYPSRAAGLGAYISTMLSGYYNAVRSATNATDAALALGQSPWAGSHYRDAAGGGPGSALVDIIDANDLTRYDAPASATAATSSGLGGGKSIPVPNPGFILGLGPPLLNVPTPNDVVKSATTDVEKVAAKVIFVGAGLAIVIVGVWRAVAPAVRPVVDRARSRATQAAALAAAA